MAVEVSIKGDDNFAAKLEKFLAVKSLTEFADKASPLILGALKIEAPKKTGHMAERLRSKRTSGVDADGVFVKLEFVGDKHPLDWVLHGTLPHEIKPKEVGTTVWTFRHGRREVTHKKKALHWVEHGHHVYRFRVNHPGIVHPSDFNKRAWRTVQPAIGRLFKATFGG